MTTLSLTPRNGSHQQPREPGTAAMLSLIPGLGQLYNGQKRKGVLFLAVGLFNTSMLMCMLFAQRMVSALELFGPIYHMKLNTALMMCLHAMRLGSAFSFTLLGLFIAFLAYAVRDASDNALLKRRQIYADTIIDMPEAASGSYLLHFSLIGALFVLVMFFLIPAPPARQVVEITFDNTAPNTTKKVESKTHSQNNSEAHGQHTPKPVAQKSSSQAERKQTVAGRQAPAHSSKSEPVPTPVPVPQPLQRTASSAAGGAAAQPQPLPARHVAPTPAPVRPLPIAALPAPAAPSSPVAAGSTPAPPSLTAPRLPTLAPAPLSAHSLPAPTLPAISRSQATSTVSATPTPFASFSAADGQAKIAAIAMPKAGIEYGASAYRPVVVGVTGSKATASAPSAPAALQNVGSNTNGTGSDHGAPRPTRATGRMPGGTNSGGPLIAVAPTVGDSGTHTHSSSGTPGAADYDNPNKDRPGAFSREGARDPDFTEYMVQLQRRIRKHWFPSHDPSSRHVIVTFKIHTNGELSDLRIDRSSGVMASDNAAIKAVEDSAPFAHLPAGAQENVDIQFTFDYNVFNGSSSGQARRF